MDAKENISTILDLNTNEQFPSDGFPIFHDSLVVGNSNSNLVPTQQRPTINDGSLPPPSHDHIFNEHVFNEHNLLDPYTPASTFITHNLE